METPIPRSLDPSSPPGGVPPGHAVMPGTEAPMIAAPPPGTGDVVGSSASPGAAVSGRRVASAPDPHPRGRVVAMEVA